MMGTGWWSMGGMAFWALLLVLAFVAVIGWLSRGGGAAEGESPERIVKRRYARGEIDREDYLRRIEDLER